MTQAAEVVGALARITVPGGQWPGLLDFLYGCSRSPAVEHREVRVCVCVCVRVCFEKKGGGGEVEQGTPAREPRLLRLRSRAPHGCKP